MMGQRHNIFHQGEPPTSDEELTGVDYMNMPHSQLAGHPDYSPHAHRVVIAISNMTSAQLESIDLGGN